jgi:peptide/nickel transport system substrate-binding protein
MQLRLRARTGRVLAAAGLVAAILLPAAAPVSAADEDRTLRLGVLQSLDSMNPYGTALVVGYEAFELSYDQLVGFGPEIEPYPAFAESWERAADGKSWTFKFRPDMKWSDGQPATSDDACFSWQLALDALAADSYIGLGYLDPSLGQAGVTKVECPDPTTMIAYTEDNSSRVLQSYLPIIPKHIWGDYTYETIAEDKLFEPPADGSGLVGSGPYQAVEWKTDEFVRFVRNPNYWGFQDQTPEEKGYAEEVVIQFYDSADTMVQALKAGELDYARTISAEQLKALETEPDIQGVNGASNGWTELGFNTYGTGTGKTIEDGGPSTKALQDPAFRDALGYAIDKQRMVESILGGYGIVGTTQVPPVLKDWHVEPTTIRTFDIEQAKQKLDAAGYLFDEAAGTRIDKEGKPINLRLVLPDSDANLAKAAEFIVEWFGQAGVKVSAKTYEEDPLIDLMLPPEADPDSDAYKADYDLFIWTWSWGPDPSDALQIFTCDQIGSSSDSLWCNEEYDKLYEDQLVAPDDAARLAILTQMQQMFYDQAPYHVLYYDDNLHAYRTDKFGGWQNQPSNGTPMFSYSVLGETLLTAPQPEASAAPSNAAPASGAPGASAPPAEGTPTSGDSTPVILGVVLLAVVVVGGGLVLMRRRGTTAEEE